MNPVVNADAAPVSQPSVRAWFARGFVAHGTAMVIQRALSFAASFLIARLGGPSLYGAFTVGMSTAGTTANYFGLAIGSVASRYSSAAPRGSMAYRRLMITFAWLAGTGAVCAALALIILADPIAVSILHNAELTLLVRLTGFLAAALILQEATMGIFDGLLAFRPLVWFSLTVGLLTLSAAVIAAPFGAPPLVAAYAAATLASVVLTIALSKRILWPRPTLEPAQSVPMREVILFGVAQVGTGIATSLASWWVIASLAAHDPSLEESGLFGVASQMRNLAILVPSFSLPVVIPMLIRHGEMSDSITRLWLFATTAMASITGGVVLLAIPVVLGLYGAAFAPAAAVIALTVAAGFTAVTASTLMRVLLTRSTRDIVISNVVSSTCLVAVALWAIPRWGAAGAGVAWLCGEVVSASIIVVLLRRHGTHFVGHLKLIWPIALFFLAEVSLALQLAHVWSPGLLIAQVLLFLAMICAIAWIAHRHQIAGVNELRRGVALVRQRLGGRF